MLVSKQFSKSIPQESRQVVLKKLESFQRALQDSEGLIREVAAGYWIRKVKNTSIFKFRLNNSDRILFKFLPKREDDQITSNILFLKYVSHDQQIKDAQNMGLPQQEIILLEIDKSSFNEEIFDEEINNEATREYWGEMANIPAIIVQDDYLEAITEDGNEDFLYYLSDEQYEPLKHFGKPIIISGSGGTGKTVVLLNKLFALNKSNLNIAYISYTELLVEDAKRLFNKFAHSDNAPDFLSIKSFYARHCGIDAERIVTYFEFNEWLKQVRFKHKKLTYIDELSLWTEIRGIIKGYLGLEYKEASALNPQTPSRILPLEHYLNLPKGYSNFSRQEREDIYKLTLDYQKWLSDNRMYDENDLSLAIINKIDANEIEPYDFLIVDEVQDLSETQLYMVSKLVKSRADIIYGGDVHQTINPTFFNFGRLKNLYYTYKVNVQDFILTKNYRNTKEIISLINKLAAYRQKLIGKTPYDYEAKAIRTGTPPVVIETTKGNIQDILNAIKDKHYAAIIVADEQDKEYLAEQCKEAEGRIFTVYEIKGLEYETIFCYNIISKYGKCWREIFEGETKRKDQFRYYINLFYVAISRAKDFLCIIEPDYKQLPADLFTECTILDKADIEKLHIIKESTNKDWEQEADRLEKVGNIHKSQVARDFSKEQRIQKINQFNHMIVSPGSPQIELNINQNNKNLNDGIKFLRLQKYNQAIESLNQFIEEFPQYPYGYYYLGMVYTYATGGIEYSIRFFDEALKLKPDWYEVYLDKAASLRFLRKTKEAIETLNRAIEINPNIGNAYFIKGMIQLEEGQFEDAEVNFLEALKLPCYTFDSTNKVWNPKPKPEEEQAFKNDIKNNYLSPCKTRTRSERFLPEEFQELLELITKNYSESTINTSNDRKDKVIATERGTAGLGDYSFFVLDKDKRLIIACIEGNIPLRTSYSTSTKTFSVQFNKDGCMQCKKYNRCPMSAAGPMGELKVRKKKLFSARPLGKE